MTDTTAPRTAADDDVLAMTREHYGRLAMSAERERQRFLRRVGGEPRTVVEAIQLLHLNGRVEGYRESVRRLRL